MAKRRAAKTVDPLKVSLKLLTLVNVESIRAVRALGKALEVSLTIPTLKILKFKIGKKSYSARVTSGERQTILNAVKQGTKVLETVNAILGGLSGEAASSANAFLNLLGSSATSPKAPGGSTGPLVDPIQLGCCIYQGGQTPNLTQAQCNNYNPTKWDNTNPSCSTITPR